MYDIQLGIRTIRLIVLSRMPKTKRSAIWHLFNTKADSFIYGSKHYDWQRPAEKAALNQLYDLYQVEGVVMPYTWEDFEKDYTREHLAFIAAGRFTKSSHTGSGIEILFSPGSSERPFSKRLTFGGD